MVDPALAKYLTAAPNYAGIAKQAGIQSRASLQPTIDELQRQQQRVRAQAALEAQQISQATLAGVNVLKGLNLPGQVAQSYRDAAANQLGAAQSYSGDLRNTMTADAEAVNRNLQALGAPGQALNQGQAAGNVLLGLGSAPATTWSQSAPSAVLAAGQVPLTLAQTGQQGELAAFAGGRQAAARLDEQIGVQAARYPDLVQSSIAKLTKAVDDRRNDAIGFYMDAVKLDQAGDRIAAQQRYNDARIAATKAHNAETERLAIISANERSAHNTALERTAGFNARTSRYRALHPSAALGGGDIHGSGTTGYFRIDPKTGQPVPLPGGLGKPHQGSPTSRQVSDSFSASTQDQITKWKSGETQKNADGVDEIVPGSRLDYDQALQRAIVLSQKPGWPSQAKRLVTSIYGDPVKKSNRNARAAKAGGLHAAEQLQQAVSHAAAGDLGVPLHYAVEAIARAYGLPVVAFDRIVREMSAAAGLVG